MEEITLPKASKTMMPVESVQIDISDDLEKELRKNKSEENYYNTQAKKLVDALKKSLPQAILERVLIELMQVHASVYRGRI